MVFLHLHFILFFMKKHNCLIFIFTIFCLSANAQSPFTFHFQQTVVSQTKTKIKAPYSGENSLIPEKETQASITATLFMGAKLWKGAEGYFDTELSGGSGLSGAKGMADLQTAKLSELEMPHPKSI